MRRIKTIKNWHVSTFFLVFSTSFTLFAILVMGSIYTFLEFREFKEESQYARQTFLESQKNLVRNETEKVVDYINFTQELLEEKMKHDLQEKCNQAWLIIKNIYEENKGKYSQDQIKKLVKDALRPIRFNNGRGYYFIVSMDGTEELYPVAPQFEGKNLIDLKDDNGDLVIKDEIEVIKKSKEGFVVDHWVKPGTAKSMIYPKTSYIKIFEPLNWYVGYGDYLDDVEKDIQKVVKEKIKGISFGNDNYIFVNTYDGQAVVINSKKYKEGDNILELTDLKGVKIIQKEIEIAKSSKGGFLEYYWVKPNTNKEAPKISFIKGVDAWGWLVGAGVYIDEIDDQISQEKKNLYSRVANQLILSFGILMAILVFVVIAARLLSLRIRKNFDIFTRKLSESVTTGSTLQEKDYTLKDLQLIINSINSIIQTKNDTEQSRKESEVRFRTIFENVPVMIAVLDKHFIFKLRNNEVDKVFDFTNMNQINKRNIRNLLTKSTINKNFINLFKTTDGQFKELELNTTQGVKNHFWSHFSTETGEIILVGYDITDMKKVQFQLREMNATKDKFFSIIGHDLKSPFNVIIGFSELLLENIDIYDKEKVKKQLLTIHDASKLSYELLENLLEWSRTQTGKIVFEPKTLYLKKIALDNIKLLELQALNKNIQIASNISDQCYANIDENMMNSVFRNLISNAIKYTYPGGKIILSSRVYSNSIEISFTDTGTGMNEETKNKLFKINEATSAVGTNNEKGTGLGLIICKEFIEKHGGRIWVDSIEGKGSTFHFQLPIQKI